MFTRPLIVRPLDLTYNPVGFWPLNGDLLDQSGNGFDLTVETGIEQYAYYNGLAGGFLFNGATSIFHNVAGTALQIAGDITVEMLVEYLDAPSGIAPNLNIKQLSYAGPTAAQADNALYDWNTGGFVAGSLGYLSFAEFGGGNNIVYTSDDGPPQRLHHAVMRRDGDVISWHVNSRLLRFASGVLTTPDGGGNSVLRIGANVGPSGFLTALVGSVKIIDRALTDAEIAEEYGRCLG